MTPKIRLQLKPTQEIAALSVQTEPAGASILLDGKPPRRPQTPLLMFLLALINLPPPWMTMNRSSRTLRFVEG